MVRIKARTKERELLYDALCPLNFLVLQPGQPGAQPGLPDFAGGAVCQLFRINIPSFY